MRELESERGLHLQGAKTGVPWPGDKRCSTSDLISPFYGQMVGPIKTRAFSFVLYNICLY